ncbi:MAG: AI-2E family transporter [Clostridium sp.]|nr:AI-2E family transporter [Clostridium sp.]
MAGAAGGRIKGLQVFGPMFWKGKDGKPMKLNMNKKYTTIAVYAFLVIAAAITFFFVISEHSVVGRMAGTFFGLMTPFIYGAALAYVLNPVLNWLEKKVFPKVFGDRVSKRSRRGLGVLLTFLFGCAVVALFLAVLIPQIVESIDNLAQSIYAFLPQAQNFLNDLIAQYGTNEMLVDVLSMLGVDISDPSMALQRLATRSYTFLTQVLPNLFGGVMRFTSGLLDVVVGIIIAIYLLLSKEIFYAQVKKLLFAFFPRRVAQATLNLTHDSNAIFCGFISGKILDSAIIGVLCFIGCSVLQMPYTVLVSFIVGVTNVIPYFGPFIGAIPSIFIIMIADPLKSLVFAVFVLILQQLDGNIIGPKILGDSTGLSAFWVIFAVTFFGGLFGFVGMLIGVPTFAVIYALVRNFAEFKLGKKGLKTQTPDFASQENPIFQKVRYHHSEQAPHTGVEVFDLDGQQPETIEQMTAYTAACDEKGADAAPKEE